MSGPADKRAWRNHNPGDLRPLALPDRWKGQSGIDAQGFVIFATAPEGWRALYKNLLAYQDLHGIRTIAAIAERWAPADDGNDPEQYARIISVVSGLPTDQTLDLHDWNTILAVAFGMSVAEAGHLPWTMDDRKAGLRLAGVVPT